ncbi:hypothetical protein SCHPADRAFT_948324 [Schizopora paradoxa]|uniref:DEAD/DEAH-box helicase domain-containing protein n=1 Tax=Schizopora paradoxa TaxID=27342 RepID=A0A0H2RFS8_9AGAM|nr:hypothetical protein SCHPADRAFT_948324 [Schizopora paradoxa]
MVDAVLQRRHHILCILPTGSGKSLASFLPAVLEEKGITVHVVPSIDLFEAVTTSASQFQNLRFGVYPACTKGDLISTRLVFLQTELLDLEDAVEWMAGIAKDGLLNRVVVDEAQLLVSCPNFRTHIRELCILSGLQVPLVMLTSSFSPDSQGALVDALGISHRTVRVVRAMCTSPPNVSFDIRPTKKRDLMDSVMHYVEGEGALKLNEKGVVWFSDHKLGTDFSQRTGIPFAFEESTFRCHELLASWGDGEWIATTYDLAHAISHKNIRVSVVYGAPYSLSQAKRQSR